MPEPDPTPDAAAAWLRFYSDRDSLPPGAISRLRALLSGYEALRAEAERMRAGETEHEWEVPQPETGPAVQATVVRSEVRPVPAVEAEAEPGEWTSEPPSTTEHMESFWLRCGEDDCIVRFEFEVDGTVVAVFPGDPRATDWPTLVVDGWLRWSVPLQPPPAPERARESEASDG